MKNVQQILSLDILKREYVDNRKSMKQIADEYGVAVGSVYKYIKKYGIESRQKMTEETKRKLSEAFKGRPSKLKGRKRSDEARKKISEARRGKYHIKSRYGGHIKKRKDGYNAVYAPNHPRASKDGYVMEHILVMEEHIGRHLTDEEVVHHKNKIRDDNRIENLQLMTFREHAGLHMKERHDKMKGEMTYQ